MKFLFQIFTNKQNFRLVLYIPDEQQFQAILNGGPSALENFLPGASGTRYPPSGTGGTAQPVAVRPSVMRPSFMRPSSASSSKPSINLVEAGKEEPILNEADEEIGVQGQSSAGAPAANKPQTMSRPQVANKPQAPNSPQAVSSTNLGNRPSNGLIKYPVYNSYFTFNGVGRDPNQQLNQQHNPYPNYPQYPNYSPSYNPYPQNVNGLPQSSQQSAPKPAVMANENAQAPVEQGPKPSPGTLSSVPNRPAANTGPQQNVPQYSSQNIPAIENNINQPNYFNAPTHQNPSSPIQIAPANVMNSQSQNPNTGNIRPSSDSPVRPATNNHPAQNVPQIHPQITPTIQNNLNQPNYFNGAIQSNPPSQQQPQFNGPAAQFVPTEQDEKPSSGDSSYVPQNAASSGPQPISPQVPQIVQASQQSQANNVPAQAVPANIPQNIPQSAPNGYNPYYPHPPPFNPYYSGYSPYPQYPQYPQVPQYPQGNQFIGNLYSPNYNTFPRIFDDVTPGKANKSEFFRKITFVASCIHLQRSIES